MGTGSSPLMSREMRSSSFTSGDIQCMITICTIILDCLLLCYFADGLGPPRGRHSVASELSVPGIDRDNSSVCHYMR